jgi:hypothetical protein
MRYVRCFNNQTLWKDDRAETFDPLLVVGHVYKVAPPQENDGPDWLRIYGEDSEDYLYPFSYFEPFHPTVTAEAEASITAHLPPDIKQLVRAEALSTGKTVSGLVREWIEERLDLAVAA